MSARRAGNSKEGGDSREGSHVLLGAPRLGALGSRTLLSKVSGRSRKMA